MNGNLSPEFVRAVHVDRVARYTAEARNAALAKELRGATERGRLPRPVRRLAAWAGARLASGAETHGAAAASTQLPDGSARQVSEA